MRKYILALIIMLVFVSVNAVAGGSHIQAKNCEIFIDKIESFENTDGGRAFNIFVKTLNFRLDGMIVEVGFRTKAEGQRCDVCRKGWHIEKLVSFWNSSDYWTLTLDLGSDYQKISYSGSFYAKTDRGVYYWFKQQNGDFLFDQELWDSLDKTGVPTQTDSMTPFNPNRCY